jgi:hypothetical protein
LRGGTNLIPYNYNNTNNRYYIGGCHSRVHKNGIHYNTHIVLLDTSEWRIVYLSKKVMYLFPENYLNKITNTNILNHESILPYHSNNLHKIQAPCSIYEKNNKYYITIDINCHITLLYEIMINIHLKQYNIGDIDKLVFLYNS